MKWKWKWWKVDIDRCHHETKEDRRKKSASRQWVDQMACCHQWVDRCRTSWYDRVDRFPLLSEVSRNSLSTLVSTEADRHDLFRPEDENLVVKLVVKLIEKLVEKLVVKLVGVFGVFGGVGAIG